MTKAKSFGDKNINDNTIQEVEEKTTKNKTIKLNNAAKKRVSIMLDENIFLEGQYYAKKNGYGTFSNFIGVLIKKELEKNND